MKPGSGTSVPPKTMVNETKAPSPRTYTHLPHIDLDGHHQFVTFRTADSVDEYVRRLSKSGLDNKIKQYKIDDYLDHSSQGDYLRGEVLHALYEYLLGKDKELYGLMAFAIMPNHVHMLFRPNRGLDSVMKTIKGGSAHMVNSILGRSGKTWAPDYYDKLVRDEKHFHTVYDYIRNNPFKAGLRDLDERYYGVYEEGGVKTPLPGKDSL